MLPRDAAKKSHVPALSSTETALPSQSRLPEKEQFEKGTLPIETCNVSSSNSFVPDKEHELDLGALLEKAKELTAAPIDLEAEEEAPIDSDDLSVDPLILPLEPLSTSDIDL
ncbi:hypothetical protein WA577_001252 [Blastocystis sp. JDR]